VTDRWLVLALRLTGTSPSRVRGLAAALRAEVRGQKALQYAARGRRGLHPDTGRVLLLVVLGLLSVGVAVGVGLLGERPLVAATLMALAQAGAGLMRAAGDVVPLVLGTDDRRVLGWWPVSERELLVARGGLVLTAVLEASVAVLAMPAVVLAVVGTPPVIAMLTALVGLLLHAVALAALLVLAVHALGRLLGRHRARRLVEVMGTVVLVIGLNVAVRVVEPLAARLAGLPDWWPLAMPPAWFGAWAALATPSVWTLGAAVAALACAVSLVGGGARALGRRDADHETPPARRRRPRRDWTAPVVAWVAPWLTGADGRALRILLRAHLREDWRFTGALLFLPGAMLLYLLVVRGDGLEEMGQGLSTLEGASIMLALWLSLLGVSLGGAVVCSTEAAAAWIVHAAAWSPTRVLALQRRLVRWLAPVPLLAVAAALLAWRGGLTPGEVVLAVAPAWLAFEIMLVFMQCVAPAASFSRAWRRDGQEFRGFHLLLAVIWPLAVAPLFLFYDRWPLGTLAVLAGQALLLLAVRRLLRRRVATRGVEGFTPRPG
jgi:hypothetical protein